MSFDKNTFLSTDLNGRMDIINNHGALLTNIRYFAYDVQLYQIDHHLIEVLIDSRKNLVQYIDVFDMNNRSTTIYANNVDISTLYS